MWYCSEEEVWETIGKWLRINQTLDNLKPNEQNQGRKEVQFLTQDKHSICYDEDSNGMNGCGNVREKAVSLEGV